MHLLIDRNVRILWKFRVLTLKFEEEEICLRELPSAHTIGSPLFMSKSGKLRQNLPGRVTTSSATRRMWPELFDYELHKLFVSPWTLLNLFLVRTRWVVIECAFLILKFESLECLKDDLLKGLLSRQTCLWRILILIVFYRNLVIKEATPEQRVILLVRLIVGMVLMVLRVDRVLLKIHLKIDHWQIFRRWTQSSTQKLR